MEITTATELTDQDRAAITPLLIPEMRRERDGSQTFRSASPEEYFLAGKRAGASEQREADARICDQYKRRFYPSDKPAEIGYTNGCVDCAYFIRSQPTARKEET